MKRIQEIQTEEKQVSIHANAQASFLFSSHQKAEVRFDNEAIMNSRRVERIKEWRQQEEKNQQEEIVSKRWWVCC